MAPVATFTNLPLKYKVTCEIEYHNPAVNREFKAEIQTEIKTWESIIHSHE